MIGINHPILVFSMVICLSSIGQSAWFLDSNPSGHVSLFLASTNNGNKNSAANQNNFWVSAAPRQSTHCTAFIPMKGDIIFKKFGCPVVQNSIPSCCQQIAKSSFASDFDHRNWQTLRNVGRNRQPLVLLASDYQGRSYESRDEFGRVNSREQQRRSLDFQDTKPYGNKGRMEDSASFRRVTMHFDLQNVR